MEKRKEEDEDRVSERNGGNRAGGLSFPHNFLSGLIVGPIPSESKYKSINIDNDND